MYPISVNLSRKSIGNPQLVEHITAIVVEYGVDYFLTDFELTEIPMDTIKIDKSFVDGIWEGKNTSKARTVIKNIISMAKDLELTCLAEGAESKEQVDLLREFGCEIVQGYYYSKPIPVKEYKKRPN